MDMRERPCADDNEMEEEGADSKSEEVLDECARVFVETFDYSVVLDSGNDGKVEWDEGHDCLEDALCEPQGTEGSQYEHDGQDDEENVVFFHGNDVFLWLQCGLLVKMNCLLGGEFFAVVAAEFQVFFVDDVKLGRYSLGVGDALGVGTLDEVFNVVGDFSGKFFNDFVVFNGNDGYQRCHKRHFAHFVFGEMFVLDFDDSFASKFGTLQVVTDKDFVFVTFQAENTDNAVDGFGGDMVNDCAVFDGRDNEFFFCFHDIVDMCIMKLCNKELLLFCTKDGGHKSLTDIDSVLSLSEVVGVGGGVDICGNLVNTW